MRIPGALALLALAACSSSSSTSPPKEEPEQPRSESAKPAEPNPGAPNPPGESTPQPQPAAEAKRPVTGAEAEAIVARLWPDGCFTFRDAAGQVHATDRARCEQPRRPYSTFKIANALLGVEVGILDGPDAKMTWDKQAIPDQPDLLEVWRKPHTLRSGMAVSAVPYFRTLARQLGEERMRAGLAKLDYGNRDMSGGLDRFWLTGGLRISAARQLAFVEALAQGKLDLSPRTQATVRDVLELART
ncbi:MAG TPA: penicillin-binding transpeptidase domain-containing protein, partial [Kofleriaceae bacterium]|nr:penicillin-binding transpeptidase domain-containing protein [Kofleriaceae bacterium]